MIKQDKKENKIKKFISSKAFYGVLAACVFAVGTVSYAAIETMRTPVTTDTPDDTASNYVVGDDEGEQVGIIVDNVPNTEETAPPEETQADTEIEDTAEDDVPSNPVAATIKPYESFFMLPLSTSMMKDYSDGQLVFSDTMRDWRAHTGIDFEAKKTSHAVAVNDGTVLAVKDDPLWGGVVEIDHGSGMISRYCGIQPAPSIKEGAAVQMGQEIGNVTSIPLESVEPLHLHFEVTVDGVNVDPLAALGKLEERE